MRRLVVTSLLAVGLLVAPSTSAWASNSLTGSATEVRAEVTGLVSEYERAFGPRVSASERGELQAMSREARGDMNTLVRLVRKAERTKNTSDWRRAHSHYVAIRQKGDERLEEAQVIIAPHMSLTEQLGAWSQARTVMQDLDSLGSRLANRAG